MLPFVLPSWFPRRLFLIPSLLSVLILLLCVAPLFFLNQRAANDVEYLTSEAKVQETLTPFIKTIRDRKAEVKDLLNSSEPLPEPKSLSELVVSLQHLAERAALRESHFVPLSESVVDKKAIRLDGAVIASPDAFRRFILLLSDQPWISGLDSCTIKGGQPLPEFSLVLWASFNGQEKP